MRYFQVCTEPKCKNYTYTTNPVPANITDKKGWATFTQELLKSDWRGWLENKCVKLRCKQCVKKKLKETYQVVTNSKGATMIWDN